MIIVAVKTLVLEPIRNTVLDVTGVPAAASADTTGAGQLHLQLPDTFNGRLEVGDEDLKERQVVSMLKKDEREITYRTNIFYG